MVAGQRLWFILQVGRLLRSVTWPRARPYRRSPGSRARDPRARQQAHLDTMLTHAARAPVRLTECDLAALPGWNREPLVLAAARSQLARWRSRARQVGGRSVPSDGHDISSGQVFRFSDGIASYPTRTPVASFRNDTPQQAAQQRQHHQKSHVAMLTSHSAHSMHGTSPSAPTPP